VPVSSQVLTFSLTVAGTERITLLQRGSLQWVDVAGSQVDTLRFTIEDVSNAFTAAEWQVVIFKIDGVAQFGGYVVKAQPTLVANGNHRAWALTCESYSTRLGRAPLIRGTWTNTTAEDIIADAFTAAGLTEFNTATYVSAGPTLTTFTANGEQLTSVLERLKALAAEDAGTDWEWQIRADKKLYFRAASADVAPFGLALVTTADWSSDFPVLGLPALSRDASLIYNRITVRGGTAPSAEITDTFTGDGSTVLFTLTTQPLRDIVRITVAGTLQSHGVDWYDSFGGGYDVLVNYSAGTLRFPDASPPAGSAAIVVVYRSDTAVVATAQSNASYTAYGNLWFDKEVSDSSITALADAQNLADALLEQYAYGSVSGTATVERFGIRAGQQVSVSFAALGLVGDYPVRKVTMSLTPGEFGIRATVNFGGQNDSLSAAVGGDGAGATSAPIVQGEVGIVRVRNRIELIDPATHFTSPSDYGNATGWVGLYDPATRTGKWLGTNSGALQAYLDSDGKIKASGVTIDALGITVTQGSIVVGSTNKLWLNDATDGALNIGGSVKAAAPFRVSATGALTATGVTITGALTPGVGSVLDGTYLSPGTVAAEKLIITAGGANLLLNSTMQVESGTTGWATGWAGYNNSVALEPFTAYDVHVAGGVDGRNYQSVTWAVNNTTVKGVYTTSVISGGVQGNWLANTTYVVSWWAAAVGTAIGTSMALYWNTAPASETWIARPNLTAAWQRYVARVAWGASVEAIGGLFISITSGAAVQGSLYIDHVQVEQSDTPSAWKPFPSELEPGSVTADKIYVASLAAIVVDTGALNMSGFLSIGAAGGIYQGTYQTGHDGDATWPETGLKIWRDGDIGRLATYNTHVAQVYFGTDGRLYAGGGDVKLDADGITFTADSSFVPTSGYRFTDGTNIFSGTSAWTSTSGREISVSVYHATADAIVSLDSSVPITSAKKAYVRLQANGNAGVQARLSLSTSGATPDAATLEFNLVTKHTFDTSGNYTMAGGAIRPASDSTTALQLGNASGTAIVTVDTTNNRVGVNGTPVLPLDAGGALNAPATSGTTRNGMLRVGYTDRTWAGSELNFGIINDGGTSYPAWIQAQKPNDLSVYRPLKLNPNGGDVIIGASTSYIGFYGVTAVARAVLATGAGATVDNVISALQNLGLVKQS
jgi:hypothetical protein